MTSASSDYTGPGDHERNILKNEPSQMDTVLNSMVKQKLPRGRPRVAPPELEPLDAERDEPIDRKVYQAIRRSLMSGGIAPGARLSSRSIANALGVSPMPVREALKRLDADGILHSTAKSAYVVHDLSADEYREIVTIRLLLEGMLVHEAAKVISPVEVEQVHWLLDRMKNSTDSRRVLQYNYKMHFLIYRTSGMHYALSIIENIWLRVGPALHRIYEAIPTDIAYEHLDALGNALLRNDPEAAERSLRNDILMNAQFLTAQLVKQDMRDQHKRT